MMIPSGGGRRTIGFSHSADLLPRGLGVGRFLKRDDFRFQCRFGFKRTGFRRVSPMADISNSEFLA
jgi:hypothetical protein